MATRDDYVEFTLQRMDKTWWREVILLTAGYLSTQSKERTTKLIQAIAKFLKESELFHSLVLATECLRDAGSNRVVGNFEAEVRQILKSEVKRPIPDMFDIKKAGWFEKLTGNADKKKMNSEMMRTLVVERRQAAMNTLSKIGFHWYPLYGEPEWVTIPAGEFWMGGDGNPVHKLSLPEYQLRACRSPMRSMRSL